MRCRMQAFVLIVMLALVACVPSTPPQQQPQNETRTEPQVIVIEPPKTTIFDEPNPDVLVLTARASRVEGYHFTLVRLPDARGGDEYFIHGMKGKIRLVTPRLVDDWSADYVYLDYEKQTATAYCVELASCKSEKRKASLPFTSFSELLPPEWIGSALYGERSGAVQLNSRPVTIVTWESEDHFYRAFLDNYYGYPHRVEIFNTAEMKNVTSGYDYQGMVFVASEEDVTPPAY